MLSQTLSRVLQTFPYKNLSTSLVNVRFQSTDYSNDCEGLVIESKNQVLWMKLNRPEKFNALTKDMYEKMTDVYEKVNKDKSIKALVLTGTGDYFSSGNDLTNLSKSLKHKDGPRAGMTESSKILRRYVDSLINLEKLLIGAINGPALGICVTTLPHCDYVIASDKATFHTPFTALGQCPEACSSYTIPRIMGTSRANELLLLNLSWDANKAKSYGFVSEVVPHLEFQSYLDNLLYGKRGIIETCYPNSLMVSKALSKDPETKRRLMDINRQECEAILELWLGKESMDAMQKFFARAKK